MPCLVLLKHNTTMMSLCSVLCRVASQEKNLQTTEECVIFGGPTPPRIQGVGGLANIGVIAAKTAVGKRMETAHSKKL